MKTRPPFHVAAIALLPSLGGHAGAQQCGDWEVVPTPIPASTTIIRDIAALGSEDVWAVGSLFNGGILPFSMRFDGNGWNLIDVPTPNDIGDGFLWAVDASGPDNIWAAGDFEKSVPGGFFGTHIYVLRWDGSGWELMDTPNLGGGSGDRVLGMKAFTPDNVWFVGDGHPQANGPQPALAMRWNGSDFELHDVPIVNPETGRDAGNPLHAISALGPEDMWAVGGSDVTARGNYSQIHHWNGSEWRHVPGPTPGYFNELFAVAAIAPDDVWAGGEYWDVNGIFGLLMHYDGNEWTQVDAPGTIFDFHAFASDDIYAVGGGVFHFDGTSWNVVESFPGVRGPSLPGLDAPPGSDCELWAGGRQLDDNDQIIPLAVRRLPGGGCPADIDGDGEVDVNDFFLYLDLFAAGDPRADITGDGSIDVNDFFAYLDAFAAGC